MTGITSSTSNPPVGHGLRDVIARVRRSLGLLGIASGYRAYMIYTKLSNLSDRELADLGIDRSDIARIAVTEM